MLRLIFVCACLWFTAGCSSSAKYTLANAHSHNDYNRSQPFKSAYSLRFGSIEADIFLDSSRTELLVGHSREETLGNPRTLDSLYLFPLEKEIEQNGGRAYKNSKRQLILLIDLKTTARPTLDMLVRKLQHYPSIIHSKTVKIVISGNRPAPDQYSDYPSFIWFDGRPAEHYNKVVLKKVALISTAYPLKGLGKSLTAEDENKIRSMIGKAHRLGKPFRFWGAPDNPETWKQMIAWKVDFINTDKVEELAEFLD